LSRWLWIVTHFGSIVFLAPLALGLAAYVFLRVGRREALRWCIAVAGCGLVTALLKIYFAGCQLYPLNVHSPSGHAAFSTIAYGGLAVVAGHHMPRAYRWSLWTATLFWIALIGVSRVVIRAHTVPEVVAGWIFGGTALLWFARGYAPPRGGSTRVLATAIVALLVLSQLPLGGWTLEPYLRQIGDTIARHPWVCAPRRIDLGLFPD
jgi:membrane-associated phospholipid phosphatase